MKESEQRKIQLMKEESRLLSEIEARKDELMDLQRKQNQMFEMVHKNLNSALDDQFRNL
jgi:predicted nuclease with TOPRIM domain